MAEESGSSPISRWQGTEQAAEDIMAASSIKYVWEAQMISWRKKKEQAHSLRFKDGWSVCPVHEGGSFTSPNLKTGKLFQLVKTFCIYSTHKWVTNTITFTVTRSHPSWTHKGDFGLMLHICIDTPHVQLNKLNKIKPTVIYTEHFLSSNSQLKAWLPFKRLAIDYLIHFQ